MSNWVNPVHYSFHLDWGVSWFLPTETVNCHMQKLLEGKIKNHLLARRTVTAGFLMVQPVLFSNQSSCLKMSWNAVRPVFFTLMFPYDRHDLVIRWFYPSDSLNSVHLQYIKPASYKVTYGPTFPPLQAFSFNLFYDTYLCTVVAWSNVKLCYCNSWLYPTSMTYNTYYCEFLLHWLHLTRRSIGTSMSWKHSKPVCLSVCLTLPSDRLFWKHRKQIIARSKIQIPSGSWQ